MRQLGDLAVWLGLIVLTIGVVYYTPVVAEYIASDNPRPTIVPVPARRPMQERPAHWTQVHRHAGAVANR